MSPKACAPTVHDCSARNPKVDTPMTIIVVCTVLLLLLPYPSSLVQGLASSNEQSQETGLSGLLKQDEEDLIVQYNKMITKLGSIAARVANIHQYVKPFVENINKDYPAVDTSELESKYDEVKSKLVLIRGTGHRIIPKQTGLIDDVENAFKNYKLQSTNAAPDLQASKAKLDDLIQQLEVLVLPLEPILKGEGFRNEVVDPLSRAKDETFYALNGSSWFRKPIVPESVWKQLDEKAMLSILVAYVKMLNCAPDAEEAIQAAKDALREYKIALGQTEIEKKGKSWSSPWVCGGKTPCYATPLGQVIALAGGFFLGGLLGVAVIENEITTTGSTLFVDSTPTSVRDGNDSSDDNSQLWIILLVVGLLLGSILALAFYYFNGKQKTRKRGAKDLEAKDPESKYLTTAEPKQSTLAGTTGTTTGSN